MTLRATNTRRCCSSSEGEEEEEEEGGGGRRMVDSDVVITFCCGSAVLLSSLLSLLEVRGDGDEAFPAFLFLRRDGSCALSESESLEEDGGEADRVFFLFFPLVSRLGREGAGPEEVETEVGRGKLEREKLEVEVAGVKAEEEDVAEVWRGERIVFSSSSVSLT
jgi:hypothetical protein